METQMKVKKPRILAPATFKRVFKTIAISQYGVKTCRKAAGVMPRMARLLTLFGLHGI